MTAPPQHDPFRTPQGTTGSDRFRSVWNGAPSARELHAAPLAEGSHRTGRRSSARRRPVIGVLGTISAY